MENRAQQCEAALTGIPDPIAFRRAVDLVYAKLEAYDLSGCECDENEFCIACATAMLFRVLKDARGE